MELYFVGDENYGPFSPRNELESLNLILSAINSLPKGLTNNAVEILNRLQDETLEKIKSYGDNNMDKMMIVKCVSNVESLLLEWGENNGVNSKLQITCKF